MKATIFSTSKHTLTDNDAKDVEIELTATEVKANQTRSFIDLADSACRIKIIDEDGYHAWFSITPICKNGYPSIEVKYLGNLNDTNKSRKISTGKYNPPED